MFTRIEWFRCEYLMNFNTQYSGWNTTDTPDCLRYYSLEYCVNISSGIVFTLEYYFEDGFLKVIALLEDIMQLLSPLSDKQ